MPDPLDLDAIEARANRAAPGPWSVDPYCSTMIWGQCDGKGCPHNDRTLRIADVRGHGHLSYHKPDGTGNALQDANANLIAYCRTDIPALVNEIRRLRAVLVEERERCAAIMDAEAKVYEEKGTGFDSAFLCGATTACIAGAAAIRRDHDARRARADRP